MPRPAVIDATRTFRLLILLAAVLPACVPLEPPPAPASPRPNLATVQYRHTVHFRTDRDVTSGEAAALRAFVANLPAGQRMSARVLGHADSRATDVHDLELSTRRAREVADALRGSGIGEIEVAMVDFDEGWPSDPDSGERARARNRRVEILITGEEVVLPGCPNWSRDPGFDPLNLPLSNLGCANAVNLGLMIADPGDLAPRRAFAPADGTREAEAIVRYRTDKVKQIEADIIQ